MMTGGLSDAADLLSDMTLGYATTYRKGNVVTEVKESLQMSRTPRYDPKGEWVVTSFSIYEKDTTGQWHIFGIPSDSLEASMLNHASSPPLPAPAPNAQLDQSAIDLNYKLPRSAVPASLSTP